VSTPLLEFADVAKCYGGVTALDGVSFMVGDDEVVGVIGANGAGKTTAFDAISGFTRPDRGGIWLRLPTGDRVDLAGLAPHRRAGLGVGRTFQNARLFGSLSVLETLRTVQHTRSRQGFWASVFGIGGGAEREITERARDVLAVVGLDAHLDKPVQELSYGMLRLCELACVVALAPRLLLLDEPSSGMAQREVEALGPILESVRARLGASIVLVEHDMPFVLGLSDRIVAMAKGAVIASGAPSEVMADPAVIESYLGDSWGARNRPAAARPRRRAPGRKVADRVEAPRA
jgi:ABC-type branched-subunit amino acid transport system ATPase component